jgi:hypothetical protein
MRDDVVALFVDPRGPYPKLVREWYDETRDARTYAGPLPVVAHPPCGPWGRLKHFAKHDDPTLALRAVEQARAFGGALEHPADSALWRVCRLPCVGGLPDQWGGYTVEVNQCDWGHPTRKRTWLYIVGVDARALSFPPSREPTHSICNGRGQRLKDGSQRQRATGAQARQTPVAFARWLLELAAQAQAQAQPLGLLGGRHV